MSIFWQFWLILVGIIALYQMSRVIRNHVENQLKLSMQDTIIHILFVLVFLDIASSCIMAALK